MFIGINTVALLPTKSVPFCFDWLCVVFKLSYEGEGKGVSLTSKTKNVSFPEVSMLERLFLCMPQILYKSVNFLLPPHEHKQKYTTRIIYQISLAGCLKSLLYQGWNVYILRAQVEVAQVRLTEIL